MQNSCTEGTLGTADPFKQLFDPCLFVACLPVNNVSVQGEESNQKKKLRRMLLGMGAEDLTRWLEGIPQLKKYSIKFAGVTGAKICATMTEEDLEDLGIA